MAHTDVTLELRCGLAVAWVRAVSWLAFFIGDRRTTRLAAWGFARLIRTRINGRPYRLSRDTRRRIAAHVIGDEP